MKSGRLERRPAFTQRPANEGRDSHSGRAHFYSRSRHQDLEVLGTSPRSANSGGDELETEPQTSKVVLPSALLEGRLGVGYRSLALPPDGAYRPLTRNIYSGDSYEKFPSNSGTTESIGSTGNSPEDSEIEPFPVPQVTKFHEDMRVAGNEGDTRKKSVTFDNTEVGKEYLSITPDVGRIGFAKLPDQVHRRAIKRGFEFTLMAVGESGLGKSTLLSSMFFQDDLYKDRVTCGAEENILKTVEIEKRQIEIEELGVRLRLTLIDTPGFNDSIDSTECWKPINQYIEDQFEKYLHDESGFNRQTIQDNQVHCCLYFVSPYGRGLRPIDVDFMKRLQHRVNIVPIIARADALTPKELNHFKSKLLDEIARHQIQIYEIPSTDSDDEEDFKRKDTEIKRAYPFAVIGGNTMIEVNGKRGQGRVYPWGIVEAENSENSDVGLLREFLLSTHLHDLKEVTKKVHYEKYRASMFHQNANAFSPVKSTADPDSDRLLKEKEEEIRRMHTKLQQMQTQLGQQGWYAR